MPANQDMDGGGLAQLGQLLSALRRRAGVVAAIVLAAAAGALALTLHRSREYDAVARVWISQSDPVNSVLSGTNPTPADPERDFNTRVQLIEQPSVAERVRRALRTSESVDALLGQVRTEVQGTADIVGIAARDTDPARAIRLANAFARAYVADRDAAARGTIEAAVARAEREQARLGPPALATPAGQALDARLRELRVDAALQTSGIEVVSLARPPAIAKSRHVIVLTALAMVLAGLLAAGVAVALEAIDRRVVREDDLEPFGLPVLAAAPPRRSGLVAEREALASLAASVQALQLRGELQVVLVASVGSEGALHGEVALGLARTLAEVGLSVTAIEADLRRPVFAEWTGLAGERGLSAVLGGRAEPEDATAQLDPATLRPVADAGPDGAEPPLSVVPAGAVPPNPLGLLNGPAMRRVVKRAREHADVVVLDAAPLDAGGDAVSLADLADGIVLAVRRGHTRHDAVERALRTLDVVRAPVLGFALLDAPRAGRGRRGRRGGTRTPAVAGVGTA